MKRIFGGLLFLLLLLLRVLAALPPCLSASRQMRIITNSMSTHNQDATTTDTHAHHHNNGRIRISHVNKPLTHNTGKADQKEILTLAHALNKLNQRLTCTGYSIFLCRHNSWTGKVFCKPCKCKNWCAGIVILPAYYKFTEIRP